MVRVEQAAHFFFVYAETGGQFYLVPSLSFDFFVEGGFEGGLRGYGDEVVPGLGG